MPGLLKPQLNVFGLSSLSSGSRRKTYVVVAGNRPHLPSMTEALIPRVRSASGSQPGLTLEIVLPLCHTCRESWQPTFLTGGREVE